MSRCAVMVRETAQCRATRGLRKVQLIDRVILVCTPCRRVMDSGGLKALVKTKRPRR